MCPYGRIVSPCIHMRLLQGVARVHGKTCALFYAREMVSTATRARSINERSMANTNLSAAKKAKTGNKTWVFCGDGDLEEGISHEAASFAGALKLDNLTLIYDSNHITIEGDTALAMADDAKKRFESYGWKVFEVDGHDPAAIDRVYRRAEKVVGAPAIIIATTHIGCGAPTKHDTADCHGAPLGADEVAGTKKALGFDPEKSFFVPDEVYAVFRARTLQQHRFANKAKKAGPEPTSFALPTRKELLKALQGGKHAGKDPGSQTSEQFLSGQKRHVWRKEGEDAGSF